MDQIKEGLFYRNKKTGDIYWVLKVATDATNGKDGRQVVAYERGDQWFVREIEEFMQKFEELPKGDQRD